MNWGAGLFDEAGNAALVWSPFRAIVVEKVGRSTLGEVAGRRSWAEGKLIGG